MRLFILLVVLMVAAGCGSEESNSISTTLNSNTASFSDTLFIDCDSIFKEKGYYIKHILFDALNDDEISSNSIFILGRNNNQIIYDSLYSKIQEIQFIDFNHDKVKDILIQNISDARSNWTYYLYLSDLASNSFNKVEGFNEIKNPSVISDLNIIESYVSSGTNYYEFFELTNEASIIKFDITVYDNHDKESERNYKNTIDELKKLK